LINKPLYVLGLMSGTSMDGLDCCLCRIDINNELNLNYDILDFKTYNYNKSLILKINSLVGSLNKDKIKKLDIELGVIFNDYAKNFLNDKKIELIASHGQTIRHESSVESVQIGNPQNLYNHFKVPVIYDFRAQDIMNGGTGAPLVPFLDWLLFKNVKKNIVTVNIGGVSNITYIPKNSLRHNVLGFDTGPGMSLIDEYTKLQFNNYYDIDGMFSQMGKVNSELLSILMNEKFILQNPPKSTTREYFGKDFLLKMVEKFKYINKHDFLRTLVKYTADSIYTNIIDHIGVEKIDEIILSGGGSKHRILVEDLKVNISNLYMMNDYNISVDAKEAFLMAVMGYSCFNKISNNMPSVTGVLNEQVYGRIYKK